MASDIGTVRDIHGYVIRVGVDCDTVTIGGAAYAMLGREGREEFQRLFMEAERQAEAHGADRTCRYCGGAIEPCTATASDCKGWVHVSGGTGPHRCDGDPLSPAAEPLAEVA